MLARFATSLLFALYCSPAFAQVPNVVTTLPPIHSIVATIMQGVGEPELLSDGRGDHHHASLKPSQLRALGAADMVVRVGPTMEESLNGSIKALAPEVTVIAMDEIAELAGTAPDRLKQDAHFWLDLEHGAALARAVSDELVRRDPNNADRYQENTATFTARMAALRSKLAARFQGLGDGAIVTAHDAFAHFEHMVGIERADTADAGHGSGLGAAGMSRLRDVLARPEGACLLAEPSTNPRLIASLTSGSAARVETVDPLGTLLDPGPALYERMINDLAEAIGRCIRPA